ncbi:MAG: indolepyruvate oxidoreductase subunit beta [Clostridia bacterium]|nr:indolepyruvate oxidoreductase subunit beta [Clostridia bacterium]
MSDFCNILLCGVGGQGIVLASKLIAQAAIADGLCARTAETIGMAQRGGCVVSHVRIGKEVPSPLVSRGGADFIISFEPAEAVRNLPFLKKGGTVLTAVKPVTPVSASLAGGYDSGAVLEFLKGTNANVYTVDTDRLIEKLGSAKAVNVLMLGAACGLPGFPITLENLKNTITDRVPERFHKLNFAALEFGAQAISI